MLQAKDIKKILSQIPAGTKMSSKEIQVLVKNNYPLSAEDLEVHTTTRPTHYQRWQHRVQAVLSEYKRKGIIQHDSATGIYTF